MAAPQTAAQDSVEWTSSDTMADRIPLSIPSASPPVTVRLEGNTLIAAGLDWSEIPASVAEEFGDQVTRVDLSFNNLRSLRNLERFKRLEELILDNNSLGDDVEVPTMLHLHTLTLNKNRISDVEALLSNAKKALPRLTYLSLLGNSACPNELVHKDEEDYQRYRYFVISQCPSLKFLDSRPISQAEHSEALRVGEFTRVVRVSEDELAWQQTQVASPVSSNFSPLPTSTRTAEEHRGTIGVCKYVYYGRHSEGNRFIRNNDL